MGLRIATNVVAMNTQRQLSQTTAEVNTSMEKLASGYRINKASDDAAGLAISEGLKADMKGLAMAKRNANDGVSLIQTAEGGIGEIGNILMRLRELTVQAASDTVGDKERGYLNKEFSVLKQEIGRISKTAEFNGTLLLVGNQDDVSENLRTNSNAYPLEIQVNKNYFSDLDGLDQAQPVNVMRIDLQEINTTPGENGLNIGEDAEDITHVASKEAAQMSMERLDIASEKVANYRSYLGSIQNRLMSTIANLSTSQESTAATNSAIRDVDFGEETARLVQGNIIKQAGISILSKANQTPEIALQLLR